MGFFSWDCPECHLSIRSHWATDNQDLQDCIVIMPDEIRYRGFYDGYGRLVESNGRTHDLMQIQPPNFQDPNWSGHEEFKMYHFKCWLKAGSPTFHQAKWSYLASDQGFFFDKEE